jgi:hypothetical protein
MKGDRQREVADGPESVSLFNQGVHLVSAVSRPVTPARMSIEIDAAGATPCLPHDSCETSASIL